MAKITSQVQVDVDVKGSDSVKSIRQEIREAQQAAIAAARAFGEFSPEAQKAQKRVAQLRDEMDDFNKQVASLNPDKFAQVGVLANGIANGFQAAQGAMALFGSESEDLQKQLLKVQGAAAFAQGIEGLNDFRKQLPLLAREAKTAFAAIRAAIGSTGIGLIVLALGAIVAYWDEIKEAVTGVSDEQKELLATTQASLAAEEKKLETIDSQENLLKLQGKTEKEILELKVAQYDQTIKAAEAQLVAQNQIAQSQVAVAKRNRDILKGILDFLTAPIRQLLALVDSIGKVVGRDFGLEGAFDNLTSGAASLIFDPEEARQEGDKLLAEQAKVLNKLKNDRAGVLLAIRNIDQQAANEALAKQKEANNKRLEEEKRAAEELKKQRELEQAEYEKFIEERNQYEAEQREKARQESDQRRADEFAKQRLAAQEQFNLVVQNGQMIEEAQKALADRLLSIDLAEREQALQYAQFYGERTIEIEAEIAKLKSEAYARDLESKRNTEAAKQQLEEDTYNLIGNISNALVALAGRNEQAAKIAALAQIAADTAVSISQATRLAFSPADPTNIATGGIASYAKLAGHLAVIFANIAKARQLLGGGGGVSGGSFSSPQLGGGQGFGSVASSLQGGDEFSNRQNQIEVFVTEGNITNTQRRVRTNRAVSVIE